MRGRGRLVLLTTLALCGSAGPAFAEDVATAEHDQRAGAQKTFEAGSKLYDSHHYGEALAAFRASYEIVASPNSRLMMARSLRELGRNAEAYREYDAVAAEASHRGERYKSTAEAATEERDELKSKVAFLTVSVADAPPDLTVKIGKDVLAPAELGVPGAFEPADAVITAATPDGRTAESSVTLTAGTASVVELHLTGAEPASAPVVQAAPPAPAPPAPSASPTSLRPWAYVAGGVGGAGLITFAIFGAMTASKFSSLESSCPDKQCPASKQGDVDTGRTYQTVANVGLGVGIVGVVAGGTLFFLSSGRAKDDTSMQVGVGFGRAELSGRF